MAAAGEEILGREVADAWAEYLQATRNQVAPRYYEVEPWAWHRLEARLKTIGARAKALRRPARIDEEDGA